MTDKKYDPPIVIDLDSFSVHHNYGKDKVTTTLTLVDKDGQKYSVPLIRPVDVFMLAYRLLGEVPPLSFKEDVEA